MEWAYSSAYDDVRIFSFYSLAYHEIAVFEIGRDKVFVAHTNIFQIERSRMTGIGTHFRPFACCWVAISPLYHIKDFLAISRHLRHWYATLLTAIAFGISS